jgi:hypothetical protein
VKASIGVITFCFAALTGCSLTVDADRKQCSTDTDCTARGTAFHGSVCVDSFCETKPPLKIERPPADAGPVEAGPADPWSCLSKPPPVTTAKAPYHVTLHLTDIVSSSPLQGVTAKLCRKLDVQCTDPQGPSVVSDAAGVVAFDVSAAFTGYVSLSEGTTIMPGLYFFNPAVTADTDVAAVQLASPSIAAALTAGVGSKQRPENGLMLLSAVNCSGGEAAGVSFETATGGDAGASVSFYSVGGLPNSKVTATDSSGYGGVVNVTPGTVVVTGRLADGRALGTISLVVNAGAITYSRMVPLGP